MIQENDLLNNKSYPLGNVISSIIHPKIFTQQPNVGQPVRAWIKKFPFQLHKRFILEKEKGKKNSSQAPRNLFSSTNLQLLSQQFHIFSLPPLPFSMRNRVTVNVSQSWWSRVIWRASSGGIEQGGEEGEEKYTFTLLDSNWQEGEDGDRLERLESSRSSRLSFSPLRVPHLFTKFFFHLAVEGRRKSNTRWISYSLRGHSRRFLDFSNYFRFLGNVCWTKGRVSKYSFNSSIFILRFDRLPFRIIHIWRSFILKYSLILGEKFFSV